MVYDYNKMTSNIPESSSLSCLDFVNDPCSRACSSNCYCQPCGLNSMLNDHTYSILKRVCRKIIKDYNRNCCSEKYTVFDGGNSVNVRIHRSSTASCGKSDRREQQAEFHSGGTHKRSKSSAERIELSSRAGDKNLQKGAGSITVNVKKGETGGKRGVKQAKSKRSFGEQSAESEGERTGQKISQSPNKQIKDKAKANVGGNIGNDSDSNKKLKKTGKKSGESEDTVSRNKGQKGKEKRASLIAEEENVEEISKKGKKGKKKGADVEDNENISDNKKGKKGTKSEDDNVESGKKGKKDKKKGAEPEDDDVSSAKKGKKGKKSMDSEENVADSGKKSKTDKKNGAEPEYEDDDFSAKKGKKGKKTNVSDKKNGDKPEESDDTAGANKSKKGKTSVVPDEEDRSGAKKIKKGQKSDEDNNIKKAKPVRSKSMPDDDEDISNKKTNLNQRKSEKTQSENAVDQRENLKKATADLPIVKDLRTKVRKGINVSATSKYKGDGEITLENAVGRKSGNSKGKSLKVLGSHPTKTSRSISKPRISSMGSRLQSDSGGQKAPPSRSDQVRPCDYLRANMEQREVCGMLTQARTDNQQCMVPQCTCQCFPRPITCVC